MSHLVIRFDPARTDGNDLVVVRIFSDGAETPVARGALADMLDHLIEAKVDLRVGPTLADLSGQLGAASIGIAMIAGAIMNNCSGDEGNEEETA